jgi:diadenosine tetraphosphate (Ap4A) HIT family hydrolase
MAICKTCQLLAARSAGTAPLWDDIYRTNHWDVVHSYNTALEGWLVLVIRRHVESLDQLTVEEAAELGRLIPIASQALKETVKCLKTYVVQFAESPDHPHVHFHVIPRMKDQPEDRKGPGVFGYLGVDESKRVKEQRMNEIAVQVREHLRQALT